MSVQSTPNATSAARLSDFTKNLIADLDAGYTTPDAVQAVFELAFGPACPNMITDDGQLNKQALAILLKQKESQIFADQPDIPATVAHDQFMSFKL